MRNIIACCNLYGVREMASHRTSRVPVLAYRIVRFNRINRIVRINRINRILTHAAEITRGRQDRQFFVFSPLALGTNACDTNKRLGVSMPVSTVRPCPHHDALGMTIRTHTHPHPGRHGELQCSLATAVPRYLHPPVCIMSDSEPVHETETRETDMICPYPVWSSAHEPVGGLTHARAQTNPRLHSPRKTG